MSKKEISVGSLVTYPKTGTTGEVISVDEINGETFYQLDKTGLFYRSDLLLPAISSEEKRDTPVEEDIRKKIENEKKLSSQEIEEAFDDVTGVGAG